MKSRFAGLWRRHRLVALALTAIAAAAVAAAVIWPVTDLIAAHDVGTIAGVGRAVQLQTAREAVRTQLLTLGAGLFAAGALVYTARNFTLSRRAVELTGRTVELTGQGQVTDRYTKAIEQLGSDKLDVRIGGIYALERIAHDSARDQPTVMEVLTAFAREHSTEQWPQAAPGAPLSGRRTRPDVQAAVSVIGRRDSRRDIMSIDLRGVDLTAANVADADFVGADLVSARLVEADLGGAHLSSADLTFANLDKVNLADADLTTADLTNANLVNASLRSANLAGADLTSANLAGADLGGASLAGADLTGANLASADLGGADLNDADLTAALWPPGLAVPEGWQRDADTGRLTRAQTNSGSETVN